jgi:hypothetical protein
MALLLCGDDDVEHSIGQEDDADAVEMGDDLSTPLLLMLLLIYCWSRHRLLPLLSRFVLRLILGVLLSGKQDGQWDKAKELNTGDRRWKDRFSGARYPIRRH